MHAIVRQIVASPIAGLRYQALRDLLDVDPFTRRMRGLARVVQASPEAQSLLATGEERPSVEPGLAALWRLSELADLGCEPGDLADPSVLLDIALDWLGAPAYEEGIPTVDDQLRLPAAREANAILATLRLGIPDGRLGDLADRLCRNQAPDGGWLDDPSPQATQSSFAHTLASLEALAFWNAMTGDSAARRAAHRAADLLLRHKLRPPTKAQAADDAPREPLAFPYHGEYSTLHALEVMKKIGWLEHPHCAPALDWLESKRLPDGGWPAEVAHPSPGVTLSAHASIWGAPDAHRANPWVTLRALTLLREAERLPDETLARDEGKLTITWAAQDDDPAAELALAPPPSPAPPTDGRGEGQRQGADASTRDVFRALVARRADELVGVLELQDYRHVSLWCVQPWEYARGVGRALMDRAIAEVQLHRPQLDRLTAHATFADRGAYETLGFRSAPGQAKPGRQPMALRLTK